MKHRNHIFFFIIQLLLFKTIKNFFVLPFDTIYIKDETIVGEDFHNTLFQNELYINLSLGTPIQNIKTILKMDKYGFIIYEDAFNYNLSSTYEIINENLRISWIWSFISYPSKDHFYLPYFNLYSNLYKYISKNKNYINEIKYNITKTNKTSFLRIYVKNINTNNFNKMFHNYGIIGLQLNGNINFNPPEFVVSLKHSNNINSYAFSFLFNTEKNKIFNNIDNKGYFIIGEELTDQNDIDNIHYTNCIKYGGEISWETYFDNIYSKNKDIKNKDNNNYTDFISKRKQGNFFINKPYILGTKEYNEFIFNIFFNELLEQNICYINDKINNNDYFSYICDSNSKIFMDNLNNNFPDLIFEHKELEENFTLTKNDLFSYNNLNKSDINLYFLVMFANLKGRDYIFSWILGIPFLKKYRLSFNYDTKQIGYYKNVGKTSKKEKKNFFCFNNKIFKITYILILISIIFILGMIYQKKRIKIPRRIKANELEYNYEYNSNKNNRINDINNYKNRNKLEKDIELGMKLID